MGSNVNTIWTLATNNTPPTFEIRHSRDQRGSSCPHHARGSGTPLLKTQVRSCVTIMCRKKSLAALVLLQFSLKTWRLFYYQSQVTFSVSKSLFLQKNVFVPKIVFIVPMKFQLPIMRFAFVHSFGAVVTPANMAISSG